jgi:hypothetical protein
MVTRRACVCGRPVTVATFRDGTLIDVIRHHVGGCPMPAEVLDRINWQPRPVTEVIYAQSMSEGWRRPPQRPPEPSEPRVWTKPRTRGRTPSRR